MPLTSKNAAKAGVHDYFENEWDGDFTHNTPKNSMVQAGGLVVSKDLNHVGNGATTDNLFIVANGPVQLLGLWGIVTALGGGGLGTDDTLNSLKIEIFPGPVDVTLANSDLTGNAQVGTLILKDAEDSVKMDVFQSDAAAYHEGPNTKVFQQGIIVPQSGSTTYIRASYTGDANTDVTIDWHVRYVPMQDDAVVTAV